MADHPVIVTTYGLAKNEYSSRIQRVITMDDLFFITNVPPLHPAKCKVKSGEEW